MKKLLITATLALTPILSRAAPLDVNSTEEAAKQTLQITGNAEKAGMEPEAIQKLITQTLTDKMKTDNVSEEDALLYSFFTGIQFQTHLLQTAWTDAVQQSFSEAQKAVEDSQAKEKATIEDTHKKLDVFQSQTRRSSDYLYLEGEVVNNS
jgi:hypothetical protein